MQWTDLGLFLIQIMLPHFCIPAHRQSDQAQCIMGAEGNSTAIFLFSLVIYSTNFKKTSNKMY